MLTDYTKDQGGDVREAQARPCQACGCRNAGRWSLTLDCGAEVFVCRLHANQGERTGRLILAAPLPLAHED